LGTPVSKNLDGLKYLGFNLKENNYSKKDWQWLYSKIEKRLLSWKNRWSNLSNLESIPVYWNSLAWVPKGLLDKINQLSFRFLWVGAKEKRPLVLAYKKGFYSKILWWMGHKKYSSFCPSYDHK
jgi:hypothetical protein